MRTAPMPDLLQDRPRAFDAEHVDTATDLTGARVRLNLDRVNHALHREGCGSQSRVVRDLPLALQVSRVGGGWHVSVDERATMGGDVVVLAGVTQEGAPVVTLARADVLAPDPRKG